MNKRVSGMGERITIKEIAMLAGVSVGTVHSALYDKPGVSEETKKRVVRIARENHYRINATAAALKRKPKKVAVVVPAMASVNRYYFNDVWAALNNYKSTINDLNILFTEIPYYINDPLFLQELRRIRENKEISGVIGFTGYMDQEGKELLRDMSLEGKTVVLLGETDAYAKALCCVLPDYKMAGRMVGELLSRQLKDAGKILLCAGDVRIAAHYEVVDGFTEFFQENGLKNQLMRKHYSHDAKDYSSSLQDIFSGDDGISACFAVTARESVLLGQALESAGKAGRILAVGSDMFAENIDFLERGVFTNLLNKNPYTQMRRALDCMVNSLARGEQPSRKELYVRTEIVFKSSLPMYKQGSTERLLI